MVLAFDARQRSGFHQALLRPRLSDAALTVLIESKWKLYAHRSSANYFRNN